MKRIVISIFVLLSVAVCTAQDLEVVPPAQGGSTEIGKPNQVSEKNDRIEAATPQDAANAAVGKLTRADNGGVQRIKVGSGTGYVAVGIGNYRTDMPNPVAVRLSRRSGAIRAYLDAQRKLAEFLEGNDIHAETFVKEVGDVINDGNNVDGSILNSSATTGEKIQTAVNAVLSAYVLYGVDYDTKGDNGEVKVSIVVTPKTLRGVTQINSEKTVLRNVKNAQAGVETIEKEILKMLENNIVFPVGGKQIYVKQSKEFAFIGYAAVPINVNPKWPAIQQRKQKMAAMTSAEVRAKANLLSMIKGNRIIYDYKDMGVTKDDFQQFEEDKKTGELKVFDEAKEGFEARSKTSEEFQSVISGKLPAGVTPKTFFYDDNGDGKDDWAFSIAIYIPSIGVEAKYLRTQTNDALKGKRTSESKPASLKRSGDLPSHRVSNDDDL